MASNAFEVKIVALDRFTKTFRNLNNQASKAARPLVNVHRQVGALAREMHLDKVAKGMGKVSDAAVNVSRTLGLSLGPLEAVFGAGGVIGGLAAAGGAAITLGVNFARTGFEVSRTSHAIGVSTRDLQRWQGAAELAGVSSDSMTQTLRSMGSTLEDAANGRDVDAAGVLRRFGIGIPMKNGVVDQNAALEELSQWFSKISNPQYRNVVAKALHIDPEVIPLLERGAAGVRQLQDRAESYGYVISESGIKQTNRFTESLNNLKVSANGAMKSLGLDAISPMVNVMDRLTERLSQSRSRPGKALLGIAFDAEKSLFRRTGLSAFPQSLSLQNVVRSVYGHEQTTTPAQRSVSGQIGGPLQQGVYVKPPQPAASGQAGSAPAGTAPPAPPGVTRNVAEQQMAGQMQFTPAELARQQADEDSAENRKQLVAAIARQRDPGARAVLEGELTKLDARLHVDVTLSNAPPGTTATARFVSADIPNATARVQFAMPSGDMP